MSFSGTNPAELSRKPQSIPSERRRHVRHGVHTPAYVGFNDSPSATALDLSEVVDISEDGACIQTVSALEVNSTLNLCLDLSEAKARINTIGLVVWSSPSGRAGIQFLEMSDASLRSLREWLFINALTACDRAASQSSPRRSDSPQLETGAVALPGAVVGPPAQSRPPGMANALPQILVTPATAQQRVEPAAGSDLDRLLQSIAERALTSTRATGAAIALSRGTEMICAASAGSDAPSGGVPLQVGSGFSGMCIRSRHLLRCEDSETDARADRETCRVLGIRSMVAVPVFSGGAVVGLLEVFSPAAHAFSSVPDAAFEYFAEEISAVLSRSVSPPQAKREMPKIRAGNRLPASVPPSIPDRKPEYSIKIVSDQLSIPRSRKMIFAATAGALVVAALSLVVPQIRHRTRVAEPTNPEPLTQPQVPPSEPAVSSVADAEDFPSLRKLAEQGDPSAQFAVGRRFATGEDVKQDYVEAVRWFAMAAEQGHIVAQATLGAYYWAGRGVPQDLTKAYYWSILAQAGGDQASKYRVAVLTSRMTRSQVLAAQQDANDWLTHHQLTGKPSPQVP